MNDLEYALVWVNETSSNKITPYLLHGADLDKFLKKDPNNLHDFDAAAGCLCAINEQNEESQLNIEELKILFVRLTERLFEKGTELEGFTYEEAFAVDVCDEIREIVGLEAALKCGLGAIVIFPTQVLLNNLLCDYLKYVNSTASNDEILCAKGVLVLREVLKNYEISGFEKENHFLISQAYIAIYNDSPSKLVHFIQNKLNGLNLSEDQKSALRSQVNRQLSHEKKEPSTGTGQHDRETKDGNGNYDQSFQEADKSKEKLIVSEVKQNTKTDQQYSESSYSQYKPRNISNLFGLTPDNPIATKGPLASEVYLKILATPNEERIQYSRIGTVQSDKFAMPVDEYEICDSEGLRIYSIYLYMYSDTQSETAPEGLLYLPISKILPAKTLEKNLPQQEIRITPSSDPSVDYSNEEKRKRNNTKTIIISFLVGYVIFKLLSIL